MATPVTNLELLGDTECEGCCSEDQPVSTYLFDADVRLQLCRGCAHTHGKLFYCARCDEYVEVDGDLCAKCSAAPASEIEEAA
jgi:hypothetical protein